MQRRDARCGRWATVLLVSALTAIAPVPQMTAPAWAAAPFSRADYDACHAQNEAGFRTAIEAITQKAMTTGLQKVDYRALVTDAWRKGGLDEIVDGRVDAAITEVRQETSWGELLKSLAIGEKAKALATAVAERVYRSDAIKTGFETVAVSVGKEIGRSIELATIDAAEPALKCIQAFLGPRYGQSVAGVVSADAAKQFAIDPATGAAAVDGATIALDSSGAIAGSVLVVVRRQLGNIAGRIGQRIVGSVLSRVVSTVAGGVGLVLIAKDIWDFRYGVLPIIEGEMKSRATKDKVVEELARALGEQMTEHGREVAGLTADRVMTIWQDFRRAHAKVIELAEKHERFRAFLDLTKPQNLPRLDEVVAIVLAEDGEAGVLKRLDDGSLNTAVNVMSRGGFEIAREQRSLGVALAWLAVAGSKIDQVAEAEIHRRAKPADFTTASLARVLGVGDKVAALRLASLTPEARASLFELEDRDLKTLARALPEAELSTLARYLTGLERPAAQRILRAVAQTPAKMQVLASAHVRDAILASRDQMAAVALMLRADNLLENPWVLQQDVQLVLDGKISPILLWDKHPVVVSLGIIPLLLLLGLLRRIVFGRSRPAQRA